MFSRRFVGSEQNIGIGRGLALAVAEARTAHVLFLEDDWVLAKSDVVLRALMGGALELLSKGVADAVRLKSDELTPQQQQHCKY